MTVSQLYTDPSLLKGLCTSEEIYCISRNFFEDEEGVGWTRTFARDECSIALSVYTTVRSIGPYICVFFISDG